MVVDDRIHLPFETLLSYVRTVFRVGSIIGYRDDFMIDLIYAIPERICNYSLHLVQHCVDVKFFLFCR